MIVMQLDENVVIPSGARRVRGGDAKQKMQKVREVWYSSDATLF
jgi:hypothetical protein